MNSQPTQLEYYYQALAYKQLFLKFIKYDGDKARYHARLYFDLFRYAYNKAGI